MAYESHDNYYTGYYRMLFDKLQHLHITFSL